MSQPNRKKSLKIQKRLGVKFGFTKHVKESKLPSDATIVDSIKESLSLSYENGFTAFVLPSDIIGQARNMQITMEEIYKNYYDSILKIKDMGNKQNIQLSLRNTIPMVVTSKIGAGVIRERLRVLSSVADIINARTIVIHPGPYKGDKEKAIEAVSEVIDDIAKESRVKISIETTGKGMEFGTLDEVLEVAKKTETAPSIHFGHLYARSNGKMKTKEDFMKVIERVLTELPHMKDDMFMFVSAVEYDKTGETKHIGFKDSDFPLKEILEAIKLSEISGTLIVDSPEREEDVKYLMDLAERVAR